jgi:hypothetical protein
MWENHRVIDQHIDHEIDRLADQCTDSVKSMLGSQAKRYFRGEISFDEANLATMRHSHIRPLLKELQQLLGMTDHPLPVPAESLSSKRSGRKSAGWTAAEDLRLLLAVARFGAKEWRWISAFVGAGRTPGQCNQRWSRTIDPAITHGPWEEEEDQKLLRAVRGIGDANWCQVAKMLTGRTDLQCRYRYLQLVKRTTLGTAIIPDQVPSSEETKHRWNSISMASFTKMDSLPVAPPAPILPYYLEASLTRREDSLDECLHRVPPLLFTRQLNPA